MKKANRLFQAPGVKEEIILELGVSTIGCDDTEPFLL